MRSSELTNLAKVTELPSDYRSHLHVERIFYDSAFSLHSNSTTAIIIIIISSSILTKLQSVWQKEMYNKA